jgi:DNA-binding MarR family transcriptional regulator
MNDLDRVIHEPARLRIATILSGVDWADFTFLLSVLKLTRGNLSSHVDRLEKAGYVEVRKAFNGKVPHTDYHLTPKGREALEQYWAELDGIRATTGRAAEASDA